MGKPAAREAIRVRLVELLGDPDALVASAAASAWGRIGAAMNRENLLGFLLELMEYPSPSMRGFVALDFCLNHPNGVMISAAMMPRALIRRATVLGQIGAAAAQEEVLAWLLELQAIRSGSCGVQPLTRWRGWGRRRL